MEGIASYAGPWCDFLIGPQMVSQQVICLVVVLVWARALLADRRYLPTLGTLERLQFSSSMEEHDVEANSE